MNAIGPVLVLFILPPMWIIVSLILSHLGGWSKLAERYRDEQPAGATVKTFNMRSGRLGIVNYSSCLSIRIYDSGMHLSVLFPFRIGHPPLFIRWSEIDTAEVRCGVLLSHLEIVIGRPKLARLELPASVHKFIPTSLTETQLATRS